MKQLIVEMGLTTDCQLKCQYCYSHHNPQYMQSFNLQTFENAIKPVMEYYGCDSYHISYFGGEPLMNWKIIEQSLPEFKASPKCSSIVVITNGLLLDADKTAFLKHWKCGISWSFDGLWSKHRTTNLEEAEVAMQYALQLTNSCKVMVSPLSRDYVENFKYFLSKGIRNPDFCLVRDDIWTRKNIEYFRNQMCDLSNFLIEYNSQIAQNSSAEVNGANGANGAVSTGLHTLYVLDAFAGAKFGKRNHGCFVGSNGILYAYDGSIWPCERFRSNNKFELYNAKTKVYNWENFSILKKSSNPQDYPKCQSCELYKYCNAGCTYSQFGKDFEIVEPIDCVCELQKICYAEGLRTYKESGPIYQAFIHRLFENAK